MEQSETFDDTGVNVYRAHTAVDAERRNLDLTSTRTSRTLLMDDDSVLVQDAEDDSLMQSAVPMTAEPLYENISLARKIGFVFVIIMTQLLCQAFLSQSIIPYNYIAATFNVADDPGEISWMSAGFSLTVGTFILIFGRIGDLVGYKKVYLCSYVWLTVWCILAGLSSYSKSVVFFDICRAMQGLSLAASFPNALALIGHYFPSRSKEQTMIFALFGAVAPGGFYIGALWNALFVQHATWPWMFYVSGIVAFLTLVGSYLVIPKNIGTSYQRLTWEMFDPIGGATAMVGLILFNFAWNQGPVVGWQVVYVYVLLIIGTLFSGLFVYWETKARYPLVPRLHPKIVMTLVCIAAGWSSFGVWVFYTIRFSLDILHQTPIVVAVQFTPSFIGGFVASGLTGATIHTIPTSIIMLFSMCAFLAGSLLSGLRPVDQVYWAQKFVSQCVIVFGMDTSFPAGVMVLSSILPKKHQGVAASLVSTVVNYSISIGLGFAGTVEYYTTRNGADELQGIRNAFYMGFGLAGLGIFLAILFTLYSYLDWKRSSSLQEDEEKNSRSITN